jgi:outer membrane protein
MSKRCFWRGLCCALILLAPIGGNLFTETAEDGSGVKNGSSAEAGSTAANDSAVNLEMVRTLALNKSPALRRLNLAVEAAKLEETSQRYSALPSVSLSGSASLNPVALASSSSGGVGASVGLGVSGSLFSGTRAALLAISKLNAESAREAARAEYYSVIGAADAAYYAVLEDQAIVDAYQSALDYSAKNLELARAKLEVGVITEADFLEVESTDESNKSSLSQARRDLSVARRKLAALTGLSLPVKIQAVDFQAYDGLVKRLSAYDDASLSAFIESVKVKAAANNPGLAQTRLARQSASQSVRKAQAAYLPSVSASASSSVGTSSGVSASFSLGLSLSLDLWNAALGVRSAQVAEQEASAALEGGQMDLALEAETGALNLVAQAQSLPSAEKALAYAEKNYENQYELYRLSSVSISGLAEASALVSSARKQLSSAQYGFLYYFSALQCLCALSSEGDVMALIY